MLINELKTQLISKDDEYFRLLGFFSDDIDKFLHVMESRRAELKQAYASQLEAVERAFLLDRSEVRRKRRIKGGRGGSRQTYNCIYKTQQSCSARVDHKGDVNMAITGIERQQGRSGELPREAAAVGACIFGRYPGSA